jgi:hypothetical protein
VNENQLHLYPVLSRGTRIVPDRPHLDVYAIYHETDEDGRRRFFKATMDQAYDWVKDREDLDHVIVVFRADKRYNRDEFITWVRRLRRQLMYTVSFPVDGQTVSKDIRGNHLVKFLEENTSLRRETMDIMFGRRRFTVNEFLEYING